jgi:hypothetical protein
LIRNDQIIVEKTEQAVHTGVAAQKFGFLRRLLMGPLGILGWSALAALAVYYCYSQVFLMGGAKVEASSSN